MTKSSGSVKVAPKKPARVEPKSFFANERTFIQWISASLLLLTVSTILADNGDYARSSALLSLSSLGLVAYASFTYFRRIKLLSSGKGYGYVDHFGPTILAMGVTLGVFLVAWDSLATTDILGQSKNSQENEAQEYQWSAGRDWEGDNNRRLRSFVHRRLATSSFFEEPGHCYQQPLFGINALTYTPNDAIVDMARDSLVVASTTEILMHSFEAGDATHLVHAHNAELGGLTAVGNRIFALSGGPRETELHAFDWTTEGRLEHKGRWVVDEVAGDVDGLTFVPDNTENGEGHLFMTINGSMFSYEVPKLEDISLARVERINMKLIGQGLGPNEGVKIASMQYFEGVTYLLHSKRNVLHAWDMETGEFLSEIPLPTPNNADLPTEWKAFTIERRSNDVASLRGSQSSSELLIHLTLDAPPQIWSFAIKDEESSRGAFSFPKCAGVNAAPIASK
jgi:hypothetical protein